MATLTFDTSTGLSGSGQHQTASNMVLVTSMNGVQTTITQSFSSSVTDTPSNTAKASLDLITTTIPAATQSTEAQSSSGPGLNILLPAIVAPVVVLLILASVVLFVCLHRRNKKKDRELLGSDDGHDSHGAPAETALLHHKNSESFTLPSPLTDGERLKEGQLGVFEKRRSFGNDRTRSNGDIVALYERAPSDRPRDPEKWVAPRVPPPIVKPMTAPPPARTPPQQRPPRQQRPPQPHPQRQPRQPAPLPLAPPPKDAPNPSWPLPADGPLPSPESMHSKPTTQSNSRATSIKSGTTRAVSTNPTSRAPSTKPPTSFQLPPLYSTEPFSMREELRPDSDTYDLSTSAATRTPPVPTNHKTQDSRVSNPFSTRSQRKRESDAVSELSYDERRSRCRRDTDTLSMVSAISHDE